MPSADLTSDVILWSSTYMVADVGVMAAYEKKTGLYGISLPRRLKSQAISSSIDTIMPPAFFLSNSFRKSCIFSVNGFPVYISGRTLIFSVGLDGLAEPQTLSTRFSFTPTSVALLFFFKVSLSFRASEAVMTAGSTPTVLPPSACSVVHSCHVGTSSRPCFNSVQLLSSCFDA